VGCGLSDAKRARRKARGDTGFIKSVTIPESTARSYEGQGILITSLDPAQSGNALRKRGREGKNRFTGDAARKSTAGEPERGVTSGSISPHAQIFRYMDKNERLFKDMLVEGRKPFCESPIEAIESIGVDNIRDFLDAFQKALMAMWNCTLCQARESERRCISEDIRLSA